MNPLDIPKLQKYVNDFSGVFTDYVAEQYDRQFAEHEAQTTEQVVTVIIPHREGNELLDIGLKVFNENGIGKKDINNGLLLIIATEEQKIRIITGKGMEARYTQMYCRTIIEDYLRPLLLAGGYSELLQTWSNIISGKITITPSKSTPLPTSNISLSPTARNKNIIIGLIILFGIGSISARTIVFFVISLIIGIASISGGIYFFRKNISETRSTKVILLTVSWIVGGFFLYIPTSQVFCQFGYTNYCINLSSSGGGGGNISNPTNIGHDDYWGGDTDTSIDWGGTSTFDGGGGSSNGGGWGD